MDTWDFPIWTKKEGAGFAGESIASAIEKECKKLCDGIPPIPPEVLPDHCLILMVYGANSVRMGIAFCWHGAKEAYIGGVLSGFEESMHPMLYSASRQFLIAHDVIEE